MAGPKKRHGFTLVELLVVITIIGMLVSLLLPAIQSAREAGRKNTCSNNMRNCVLALSQFENNKRGFPGYANTVGNKTTSWVVPILPLLERNDIYQSWQNSNILQITAANSFQFVTPLAVLVCPSNPAPISGSNPLSFVVNTGSASTANDNNPASIAYKSMTPFNGENWPEDINSGVFFDQTKDPTLHLQIDYQLPSKKVTMDFIGTNDGTSYTLMMSENLQAFNWALDPTDATGYTQFQSDFAARQGTGMVWYITGLNNPANGGPPTAAAGANYDPLAIGINGQAKVITTTAPSKVYPNPVVTSVGGLAYARPSSNHPGGVNAFFCDGHGRFIAEDIGYNVYTQLMTPNQKGVAITSLASGSPTLAQSSWSYLLNEADY